MLIKTWRKRRRNDNENKKDKNCETQKENDGWSFREPASTCVLNVPQLEDLVCAPAVPSQLSKEDLQTSRSLGQIDKKFVAVTCRNGTVLALVDQHAADERVVLENMLDETAMKHQNSLKLPKPLLLEGIGPEELALFEACEELALDWGWQWSTPISGGGKIEVTHVPLIGERPIPASELRLFINSQQDCKVIDRKMAPRAISRAYASQACRAAIKFGDELTNEECSELLKKLIETRLCFICAHGRPTILPMLDIKRVTKASAALKKGVKRLETRKNSELKARLQRYILHSSSG